MRQTHLVQQKNAQEQALGRQLYEWRSSESTIDCMLTDPFLLNPKMALAGSIQTVTSVSRHLVSPLFPTGF